MSQVNLKDFLELYVLPHSLASTLCQMHSTKNNELRKERKTVQDNSYEKH